MKRILDVEGNETSVAVHTVQHLIHAPEHLPEWADAERGPRIVSIVQRLPQDVVERSLQAFHCLGAHGGKDRR